MEQMMERLAAAKEKMEARIDISNEKFEVLRGTLVSWMDIHQDRTEAIQEEDGCPSGKNGCLY
jgi:hypothetical protein